MSGFDKNSMEITEEPVTQLKEITGENGITKAYKKDNMYFIPKGTTLYRGDSNFENKDDSCLLKDEKCEKDASFKFFTPDENYAYKYGLLFEFKTTTDLNLVAMDDISKDFFINAPEEIQDILEENYGYSSHKRNSVEEKDYKLSEYICDEKYQGYAANTMKNVARLEDDLNAEVIICNPENHLISIRRIIRDEDQSKLEELRMRRTESDRVGPQKKPRRDIEDRPKPPSMGSLFGDDEEDDEDNFKPKSLFGGKTKKSKKSKKKKTKTQKKRKSRKSKTNKK